MEIKYKNATRWRQVTAGLVVVCILLTVVIIVLAVLYSNAIQASKDRYPCSERIQLTSTNGCSIPTTNQALSIQVENSSPTPDAISTTAQQTTPLETTTPANNNDIDTSEPEEPGLFHDLTITELQTIILYLSSVSELGLRDTFGLTASVLSSIDLILPTKRDSLAYLDGTGPKPPRKARVILYRGDLQPPTVQEYMVTLNTNSSTHELINYRNRRNPVEYASRPFHGSAESLLMAEVQHKIGYILYESYGTTLSSCGRKCLISMPFAVSSAFTGKHERRMWLQLYYYADFFSLYPVDMMFYVNVDGTNSSSFSVDKVVYGGKFWNSIDEFKTAYDSGSIEKSIFTVPSITPNSFSTLHRRGPPTTPFSDRRPPHFVEPDGPRYTIKHNHIEYMNWQFDVRMSTFNGPQMFDIKFAGERIAYEVGLQEIAVFYSGHSPVFRSAHLVDGAFFLGYKSEELTSGVDCPETATYIETANINMKRKKTFCVFELNAGIPLRRHKNSFGSRSYSGMVDNCLIVRTILVLSNYDYIFDFIFHQSGIMETKVVSTGYILAGVYSPKEKEYGFEIENGLLGSIHNHLFHFKVDLDVVGTSNRYDTLEFKPVNVSNDDWLPKSNIEQTQISFDRVLKKSELEAAYKFNFDTPKEHIFYNEANKTAYGVPRAYKVKLSGMNKQLLPEGMLGESSISWARYQMAVTKHKDEEYTSTSIYAVFDGLDPVVNFTKFIADNENIVDEDLVLWISMGMYHLPHSEDLPLTQTPGKHLSFMLAPHNYFKEDPSMSSNDQVRN